MQPMPTGEVGGSKGKGSRTGGESPGLHAATRRKLGDTGSDGAERFTLARREGLSPVGVCSGAA
jgi:hypothetical protein